MGVVFQSIADLFFGTPTLEFRLQIIGFENAGKTTILHQLQPNQQAESDDRTKKLPETVPTIGMNSEEIEVNNLKIKVWDLSGQ